MITRDEIVAAARGWLDVPFKLGGRSREGVDCIGFLLVVAKDIGYPTNAPDHYPKTATALLHYYIDQHLIKTKRITVRDLIKGDVVCLVGLHARPTHFGVVGDYNGEPTLIHVSRRMGRVMEHRFDNFWSDRIDGVYELFSFEPVQVPA